MRFRYVRLFLFLILIVNVFRSERLFAQKLAIKSNTITLLSGIPNIGIEYSIAQRSTIELSYYHKYYELENQGRFRFYISQFEYKYWFCREYVGGFLGTHIFLSEYNIGRLNAFNIRNYRYQGKAYASGLSIGYNYLLNRRWNLEMTLGFGYIRFEYEKFKCEHCGDLLDKEVMDCIGPTKVGVNLIYLIK